MRSEKEMMNLILTIAQNDEKIRAVYMNGSRVNKAIKKDIFQDYDVVFVVSCLKDYLNQPKWLNQLGERLIMQIPDRNDENLGSYTHNKDSFAYLMLFEDGNRIDLTIVSIEYMLKHIHDDSLVIKYLDKDNIIPKLNPPSSQSHYILKPNLLQFQSVCNDFWWCTQNVAKGLIREEHVYAVNMFNELLKKHLEKILTWYIGTNNSFSVSVGYLGKHLKVYLPSEYYQAYISLYFTGEIEHNWKVLFNTCKMFNDIALLVAKNLNFTYDHDEANNMFRYLNRVYSENASK